MHIGSGREPTSPPSSRKARRCARHPELPRQPKTLVARPPGWVSGHPEQQAGACCCNGLIVLRTPAALLPDCSVVAPHRAKERLHARVGQLRLHARAAHPQRSSRRLVPPRHEPGGQATARGVSFRRPSYDGAGPASSFSSTIRSDGSVAELATGLRGNLAHCDREDPLASGKQIDQLIGRGDLVQPKQPSLISVTLARSSTPISRRALNRRLDVLQRDPQIEQPL